MGNNAEEQPKTGECSFKFHDFVIDTGYHTFSCHAIKMDNCLYLWVGDSKENVMNDLSFAIVSPFAKEPLTTHVLGAISDDTSSNLAQRLSKKLSKPVYVSLNVQVNHPTLFILETKLRDELTTHPDIF
ncbi:proteasome assembly chaperone 4 [Augochlora pura]